jgi:hypothetical protein
MSSLVIHSLWTHKQLTPESSATCIVCIHMKVWKTNNIFLRNVMNLMFLKAFEIWLSPHMKERDS